MHAPEELFNLLYGYIIYYNLLLVTRIHPYHKVPNISNEGAQPKIHL